MHFESYLPQSYIKNGQFDLVYWYAKIRSKEASLGSHVDGRYHYQLGDAISAVALKLLEDSIVSHFPNTNPDTDTDSWFGVYLKDWGSDTYVINDLDLDILTEIPIELLNNSTFNLIGWYCKLPWESGVFHNKYKRFHKKKYVLEQSSELLEIDNIPGSTRLDDNELSEQSINIDDSRNEVVLLNCIGEVLISCQPYPSNHDNLSLELTDGRFVLKHEDNDNICIYDAANQMVCGMLHIQ